MFPCLLQTASKAGFIISPVAGKKGHFQAQKLGQIEILVGKNYTMVKLIFWTVEIEKISMTHPHPLHALSIMSPRGTVGRKSEVLIEM